MAGTNKSNPPSISKLAASQLAGWAAAVASEAPKASGASGSTTSIPKSASGAAIIDSPANVRRKLFASFIFSIRIPFLHFVYAAGKTLGGAVSHRQRQESQIFGNPFPRFGNVVHGAERNAICTV